MAAKPKLSKVEKATNKWTENFLSTTTRFTDMLNENPDMAKDVKTSDYLKFYELMYAPGQNSMMGGVGMGGGADKGSKGFLCCKFPNKTEDDEEDWPDVEGGKMPLRVWGKSPLFNRDQCINCGCCITHCKLPCPPKCVTATCGAGPAATTCTCVPELCSPFLGPIPCCALTKITDQPAGGGKMIVKASAEGLMPTE